jgi:hypothetical protein
MFFDRETFGRDALVAGDSLLSRGAASDAGLASFIAAMRLPKLANCIALTIRSGARSAGRQVNARKSSGPQDHELSRLPDQNLRLQRGGKAARSDFSGSAAMSFPHSICAASAIPGSGSSSRPMIIRNGMSHTFIISPTAMRRWRGY